MSAKACNRCGAPIVFGEDQETGKIIALTVGAKVYRLIKKNIVAIDTKAFVPHACPTHWTEGPQRNFSEPKEEL